MIKFKRIIFRNFLSFGKNDTTIDLDRQGITLISGGNGAGKSTITDAIVFALFGKAYRAIPKPEIINDRNNKDCFVSIDFIVDNVSYTINRGIKPDILEVVKDGKPLDRSNVRDMQLIIERDILQTTYASFCQLIMLSKTNFKPFLEYSAKERRDFIEHELDLSVYRHMGEENSNNIKLNNKAISLNDKDIEHYSNMVSTLKEQFDSQTQYKSKEMDILKERRIKELDILNTRLESSKNNLSKLLEDLKNTPVGDIKPTDEIEQSLNNLIKSFTEVEIDGKNHSNLIEFFSENDECPTCTQYINPNWKKEKVTTLKAEIAEIKKNYVDIRTDKRRTEEELKSIKEENSRHAQYATKRTILGVEISNAESSIKSIETQIDELNRMPISLTEDTRPTLENSIIEYENKLANALKLQSELTAKADMYASTSAILKEGGVISMIVNKYIDIINEYMSVFIGRMGLDIIFTLDNTFNDTIERLYGKKSTYYSLSEGQKLRVNLSMVLTWRLISRLQGGQSSNLLFFDEMFDSSLDQSGIDTFLEILKEIDDINILIISHTPSKIDAHNHIDIAIESGFSYIV